MLKYIDGHCHFNPNTITAESLLRMMDRNNIETSYLVGGGLLPPAQIAAQIIHPPVDGETRAVDFDNAALLNATRNHADRLRPFYFVNPWRSPNDLEVEGEKFENFWGLKFAAAVHGVQYEKLDRWFAFAEKKDLPVYTHCLHSNGFSVADLIALANRFPRVNIILGHGGISQMDLLALQLVKNAPNVLIETSGTFSSFLRFASDTIGASRLLLGSEFPLQAPEVEIAKLHAARLSEHERFLIGRGNAENLFLGDKKTVKKRKITSCDEGVSFV